MVTQIAQVKIARTETGSQVITCSQCPNFYTVRGSRPEADAVAAAHQKSHVQPTRDEDWL